MKFVFLVILMFDASYCLTQTCNIRDEQWFENSYDEPKRRFHLCYISGAQFLNENDPVQTNFTGPATLIEMFQYYGSNTVKFIPNSIFSTFPNMEYFKMYEADQHFATMKSHYLINARNLKVFHVTKQKQFKRLEANVFVEAANLEHINLQTNGLEFIHGSAFNGLPKLKEVYMYRNKITQLHPSTFSSLLSLQVLDLLNNVCIKKKYENATYEKTRIESDIKEVCSYPLSTELAAIEMKKEFEKRNKIIEEEKLNSNKILTENLNKEREETKNLKINLIEFKKNLTNVEEKLKTAESKSQELEGTVANLTNSLNMTQKLKEVEVNAIKTCNENVNVLELTVETLKQDHAKEVAKLKNNYQIEELPANTEEIFKKLKEILIDLQHEKFMESEKIWQVRFEDQALHFKQTQEKMQESMDSCKAEIQKSELKCSNNYLSIVKLVQEQKFGDDEKIKKCKQ